MNKTIDDYTFQKLIGKGSFGEVYLAKKQNSDKLYAIKMIDKKLADTKMRRYFEYEIKILKMLNHPNIVKLEKLKISLHNYYIIMEYVNGGELSNYLKIYKFKYGKAFPEEVVQYLMKQIVDALVYIHDKNIIHRDLKLENIMVSFDSEKDKEDLNMMKAKIKIIDFGFAIILLSDDYLTNTAVGTMLYMDPTILEEFYKQAKVDKKRGYGKEADIWSLGCICYELFRGKFPFEASNIQELYGKINFDGKYKIPKTASREIISFLEKMLQYDGKKRLTAIELMNEPFLTKDVKDFTYIEGENQEKIQKRHTFPMFKDSIKLLKEKKEKERLEKEKREQEKKYQKLNSLPDKPIKEDTLNNLEGISINEQPKIINTPPKAQNKMFQPLKNHNNITGINKNFKNNFGNRENKIPASNIYQNRQKKYLGNNNQINNNNITK